MLTTMRFNSIKERLQYYYAAQIKCQYEIEVNLKHQQSCKSGKYVDCDSYGGFDPVDLCK